jgi:hypothetical protein
MKRHTILILAVFIVAVMLLGTALETRASPSRTDFTVTEYVCAPELPEPWFTGNVMHIRDYKHVNVDDSTTPEVNGLNTTIADADINLKTGIANIRGTFSIQPEGFAGTWEGTWVFNGTPGVGFARGVGRGTGVFAGKHIFLKVYDLPPDPDTNAEKCAEIGYPDYPEGVELVEGYILEP